MAFNNEYSFFRKNGGYLNEEYNILPMFGFDSKSEVRRSVENIGSKTTATYVGNGKFEYSTSAPNLYFKNIGYDVSYTRKKAPEGKELELEERFQELLKKEGKSIDSTKYISPNLVKFYSDGARPTPDFREPKIGGFILAGIISFICMVAAVVLVGIAFADRIMEMLPDFVQKIGLGPMQVAYPLFLLIFGLMALFFFIAWKKNKDYKERLAVFKARPLRELKYNEVEELKRKMYSTADIYYDLNSEKADIIKQMITINNQKIGYK